jgi:hypothetical protein
VRPAFSLVVFAGLLVGCRAYTESTPRHYLQGGPEVNYKRIFHKPRPAAVRVVNSWVIVYGWRPGVITTDDFEFELLASEQWIQEEGRHFGLRRDDSDFFKRELAHRKESAAPWYAPKPLDQYDLYRDITERGFVHMLVQKKPETDGRRRIFISKH